MVNLREELIFQGKAAKEAARILADVSTDVKNRVLETLAANLESSAPEIVGENMKDLRAGEAAGLSRAMLDRLELNPRRIEAMAEGLLGLVSLPDPVGEIAEMRRMPNGLQIGKMRVPLGVVGMIYEARPNVTIDAAGLCFKAGNAVILRGGSEAINTNKILVKIAVDVLTGFGLPASSIQMVSSTDREAVSLCWVCMNTWMC